MSRGDNAGYGSRVARRNGCAHQESHGYRMAHVRADYRRTWHIQFPNASPIRAETTPTSAAVTKLAPIGITGCTPHIPRTESQYSYRHGPSRTKYAQLSARK